MVSQSPRTPVGPAAPASSVPPRNGGPIGVPIDEPAQALELRIKALTQAYLADFTAVMDQLARMNVASVVERLRDARDTGATIFIAGNGGSAATATHWANDLGKATRASGRAYIRVLSLTDNVSWLTALANDEGYERAFSGQLENLARPGDVLAVISASGSSPNVVAAVDTARSIGMVTIGLLGFDGGLLAGRLDAELLVRTPRGAYGIVETAHALLADVVTSCLVADRAAL